jgi:hypothetical protein
MLLCTAVSGHPEFVQVAISQAPDPVLGRAEEGKNEPGGQKSGTSYASGFSSKHTNATSSAKI